MYQRFRGDTSSSVIEAPVTLRTCHAAPLFPRTELISARKRSIDRLQAAGGFGEEHRRGGIKSARAVVSLRRNGGSMGAMESGNSRGTDASIQPSSDARWDILVDGHHRPAGLRWHAVADRAVEKSRCHALLATRLGRTDEALEYAAPAPMQPTSFIGQPCLRHPTAFHGIFQRTY